MSRVKSEVLLLAQFHACECGRRCWTAEVKPVRVMCLRCERVMQTSTVTPEQAARQMALPVDIKEGGFKYASARTAPSRNGKGRR